MVRSKRPAPPESDDDEIFQVSSGEGSDNPSPPAADILPRRYFTRASANRPTVRPQQLVCRSKVQIMSRRPAKRPRMKFPVGYKPTTSKIPATASDSSPSAIGSPSTEAGDSLKAPLTVGNSVSPSPTITATSIPPNSTVQSDSHPTPVVPQSQSEQPPTSGTAPAPSPGSSSPLLLSRDDCELRTFHEELYFDFKAFMTSSISRDSMLLCQKYSLEPFMVPRPFFYPRIIRMFYKTMTTDEVKFPSSLRFEIDGKISTLTAESVAQALQIPFTPRNPFDFTLAVAASVSDMVRVVSQGNKSGTSILKRELDPQLWLVDHVLRANVYPCQHAMERRGLLLEALFRILNGHWWCPAHLFMAALFYFEERVHIKKLQRAQNYQLLCPRLLSTILKFHGFVANPAQELKKDCRDVFTLDRWQAAYIRAEPHSFGASLSAATTHVFVPLVHLVDELDGNASDTPPVQAPGQLPISMSSTTTRPSVTIPPRSPPADHVLLSAQDFCQLLFRIESFQTTQTQLIARMDSLQMSQTQMMKHMELLSMMMQQRVPVIPSPSSTGLPTVPEEEPIDPSTVTKDDPAT